jgi:hypothetical protein
LIKGGAASEIPDEYNNFSSVKLKPMLALNPSKLEFDRSLSMIESDEKG